MQASYALPAGPLAGRGITPDPRPLEALTLKIDNYQQHLVFQLRLILLENVFYLRRLQRPADQTFLRAATGSVSP